MKKLIFLILLSILSIHNSEAQEEVIFKSSHLPNKTILQELIQISDNKMTYSGSEELLLNLEYQGIENPTISSDTTNTKSIIRTGKLEGNRFPLEMKIVETTEKSLPAGTIFHGHITDGTVKMDSITARFMPPLNKKMILESMESLFNQIKMEDRKVKVGESYEQTKLVTLPIAGAVFDMTINLTYTLEKIVDRIAYFDLKQDFIFDTNFEELEELTMEGNGKGGGKIEYDIENQINLLFYTDTLMDLQLFFTDFSLHAETRTIQQITTTVLESEME